MKSIDPAIVKRVTGKYFTDYQIFHSSTFSNKVRCRSPKDHTAQITLYGAFKTVREFLAATGIRKCDFDHSGGTTSNDEHCEVCLKEPGKLFWLGDGSFELQRYPTDES